MADGPTISEDRIKPDNFENVVISIPVQSALVIDLGQSTIAPSDNIARSSSINASVPMLTAPEAPGAIKIANNKAIDAILDSWLKGIEEWKKMIEEELKSPKYLAFLERQSPAFLAKLERAAGLSDPAPTAIADYLAKNPTSTAHQIYMDSLKQSLSLATSLENGIRTFTTRVHEGNATAIQALSHFTPLFVNGVSAPMGGVLVVGMTGAKEVVAPGVFEKIWQSAALIIPSDARVELGWMAALLGAGLITQTQADGVLNFKPGGKPNQMDIAEARVFAKNVIVSLDNPEVNLLIQSMIIPQMENGQQISEERRTQLANMIKIVLLSMALALVYRTETGGLTGQELESMLSGEMVFDKNDVKSTLVGLLNNYLTTLDSTERRLLKDGIFNFLESKPPLDQLFQLGRVFQGVQHSLNVAA